MTQWDPWTLTPASAIHGCDRAERRPQRGAPADACCWTQLDRQRDDPNCPSSATEGWSPESCDVESELTRYHLGLEVAVKYVVGVLLMGLIFTACGNPGGPGSG